MSPTLEELTVEVREVALQVSNAQDRAEERDIVLAARERVDRLADRYRLLLAALGESQKLQVERQLGRRIVDIKRLVSLLPKVGVQEGSTPDRQVSGPSNPGERRITGVSWGAGRALGAAPAGRKVGGDVEAWCGPCGDLKTHSIVAMVGDEPRQVVCQTCNGRHNFRTTPARKAQPDEGSGATLPVREGEHARRQAEKKAEDQRSLAREVNATDARPFNPKDRYKPGEVIVHIEFGRGRIETVLRSSLLVRFAEGGLKSLMLS